MDQSNFEWTPDFWQGWRESENPYRKYKSERDRQLVAQSMELHDGERVLEVGCGYGWISQTLWNGAHIEWIGIDRSIDMVKRLRASHVRRASQALLADATQLPFADGRFDKVVCTGVLMHIALDQSAVHELIRVLRPGGMLLCSINNALSPYCLPVRLWNQRKKGFVQKFRLPGSFRKTLRDRGVRADSMTGDGIIATVPMAVGPFHFPPWRLSSSVCRWDRSVSDRFAWLAYEVWFRGVKVIPPCAF
jgi:SAM-dependent methyltransferase